MALQHQTAQRGPTKEHFGYACEFWGKTTARKMTDTIYLLVLLSHLIAQDPQMLDQLAKNITRCGLSNSTLNYLRVRKFLIV